MPKDVRDLRPLRERVLLVRRRSATCGTRARRKLRSSGETVRIGACRFGVDCANPGTACMIIRGVGGRGRRRRLHPRYKQRSKRRRSVISGGRTLGLW